mmetsp:Transcript_57794/g.141771  ORF Transcript_57794/g.141771 Transcript_57794/m.141771 type:complete len:143 (+) Transcript_57794:197-625(+)
MATCLEWAVRPFVPPARVARVEPKQFYQNERTFLTWLNMATTVGSISTALVAFGMNDPKHGGSISVLASVLAVVAIVFCIYSMLIYFWRRRTIRRKEDGNYDDPYGPQALAMVLVILYATVFALGVTKLADNDAFLMAIGLR